VYVAKVAGVDLRIHRHFHEGWTLAIVASRSTETTATPVLLQRALSDVATEDDSAAKDAALRVAEEALQPIADAYSDIAEWLMR
jgi:hypothetical protein